MAGYIVAETFKRTLDILTGQRGRDPTATDIAYS